jgi:ABC-2 type transport system permease protein
VALALGFGAIYADFKTENRAAAVGSFGAILFLLTCLVLVGVTLALGAMPAYGLTKKWLQGLPLVYADFFGLAAWAACSCGLFFLLARNFLRKGVQVINERF